MSTVPDAPPPPPEEMQKAFDQVNAFAAGKPINVVNPDVLGS